MVTIVIMAAVRAAKIMNGQIKKMRVVTAIISVNYRICLSKELGSKSCPKRLSEKEDLWQCGIE